jgi:hypothetical protein
MVIDMLIERRELLMAADTKLNYLPSRGSDSLFTEATSRFGKRVLSALMVMPAEIRPCLGTDIESTTIRGYTNTESSPAMI